MKSNLVDLMVIFQHQTEKAVCIREYEDGEDIWIPKAQCEMEPEAPIRGLTVDLTLPESVAIEKGLV